MYPATIDLLLYTADATVLTFLEGNKSTGVLISPYPEQEGNKLGSMSGTRAIFFFLQGKAPKEIHAILTETLACFLPGRAKDLSAPPVLSF